jgi:hypothetical protein
MCAQNGQLGKHLCCMLVTLNSSTRIIGALSDIEDLHIQCILKKLQQFAYYLLLSWCNFLDCDFFSKLLAFAGMWALFMGRTIFRRIPITLAGTKVSAGVNGG